MKHSCFLKRSTRRPITKYHHSATATVILSFCVAMGTTISPLFRRSDGWIRGVYGFLIRQGPLCPSKRVQLTGCCCSIFSVSRGLAASDVASCAPTRNSSSLASLKGPFNPSTWSIADHRAFEECYAATSLTANPYNDTKIDTILHGLGSPAPHSLYVIQRAIQQSPSVEKALSQLTHLLKNGHAFFVRESDSGTQIIADESLSWTIRPLGQDPGRGWKPVVPREKILNVKQLATAALDLVVEASERQCPVDESQFDALMDQLQHQLELTLGTDIRGRTLIDTIFNLALAGLQDDVMFERLVKLLSLELQRVGSRPSRKAKDLLQMVEKLAASGVKGKEVDQVYQNVANILCQKEQHLDIAKILSQPGRFDLLSPRPLLWLWRFSARQSKAKADDPSSQRANSSPRQWIDQFSNPSRQLVMDIGCGFGVSLIGLASLSKNHCETSHFQIPINLDECNFVGGDLSQLAIRYANSISHRWNLADRLQFTYASASDLLDSVTYQYPGKVKLIMIQFPTPFRLSGEKYNDGNSQLPTNADDDSGFLASHMILKKIAVLLGKGIGDCYLLIQSNCEDVAIYMRNVGCSVGLEVVPAYHPVFEPILPDNASVRLTDRTKAWIQLGGERAVGPEWSSRPLLPDRCWTETEVACQIQKTPVHRCLLKVRRSVNSV